MRTTEFIRVTLCLTISMLLLLSMPQRTPADLIAYYPFEGDSTDASGNGNDGFDDGDAEAAGPFTGFDGVGQAYEFFGGGHVVVPIDINPSVLPDLTVTMWVKPDEFIIDSPGLYKTFGHDDGGWDRTFGLDNREGEYRYAAFTGGAGPGPTATTGTEIDSEWTFIATVWDTDATGPGQHTVRFHANENSVEQPLTNTPSAHVESAIGNLRPDNFAEGWQGLIDDVRIFDQALTEEQVESVMLSGEPDPVISVMAILNEDQETHDTNGVPNTAAGVATATYTRATGELTWDVQWNGLSGNATAMHFHGPAEVGEAAGVQVDIGGAGGLTSPSTGTLNITAAQAEEMAAGQWYANIHTAANGPGEIRGQLKRLRPVDWTGGDSGLWDEANWSRAPNENHTVSISPAGSASVLGPADDALVYSLALGSTDDGVAELRLRPGGTFATLGGIDVSAKGRLVGAGTLTGPLDVQSGGELVVLTGDTFQASGTMRPIAGVVTSMGNLAFEKNVTNLSEGVINATSSTLTFPGNGAKDEIGLTNQGTLNLTRAVVNGDVHSPSGSSINVGVEVVFNGLVSGAADFAGAGLVTFNGGFDPGDSPAKMLFGGDVVFGEENTVRFEIGGLIPGDEYDQVNVLGTVDLNGRLTIELMENFAPSFGDEFVLMNFGGKSDLWFSDVVLPEGQWMVESSDHQLTLMAIPEPSGALLALAALPFVGCFRRRRRATALRAEQLEHAARSFQRTVGLRPLGHLLVMIVASLLTASSVHADLIAYYPFDDDASDQSGSGNDGIEEGDAMPAGPFSGFNGIGGAYSFEGAGHVVVPIDINPDVIEELTVAMWVKPDERIVNSPGLYKTFGHDDGGWDRTFGLDSRNGPYRYAAFTGGAGPGPTTETGTPITSEWTFLASVWSIDEENVTFYVNENSVDELVTETFSVHVDSAIGNLRPDNFNEGWQGLIDEVRIFDEALSPSEIEQIRLIGQTEERDFVNPNGGLWDDGSNWTGLGGPNDGTTVTIQPDNGLTVLGPADNATVVSLMIGANNGVAELRLTGNQTFATTSGLTIQDRGRLTGNGTINSDLTVEAGGELNVMFGESLLLSGTAGPVSGVVNVMGNLTADNPISIAAAGRFNVVGGTLNVPGNNQKDNIGLTNAGKLDLTNATVMGDVHSPAGATINVVESASFGGLVSGAGNFPGAGTVNLNGGYEPGDSAALVEFSGDVNFGENNELLIEIGGLVAGTEHDQLDIAGDVGLGGDLRVTLINDFVPAEGSQFAIMNYNSRNDTVFANVVFPDAGWSVTYGDQVLLVSFGDGGLPGDYNSDGVVNVVDIDLQAEAMNVANPDLATFDENLDGQVSFADREILIGKHIGTWIGDANLDGLFDTSDFVAVFNVGKYETGQMAGWAEGDWNGDLEFDTSDFVVAFADGGYEAGERPAMAAAVPEPATVSLIVVGMAGLFAMRRRRG